MSGFQVPHTIVRMENGMLETTFGWFLRNGKDVIEYCGGDDVSVNQLRAYDRKWRRWATVRIFTVDGVAIMEVLRFWWKKPTVAQLAAIRPEDVSRRKVTKVDGKTFRGKHVCCGVVVRKVEKTKDGFVVHSVEAEAAKPQADKEKSDG